MISKLPIRKATIAFTAIPIRLILVKLLIKAFNIKDLNHIYKTQHIVSANFINCYHQCSIPALDMEKLRTKIFAINEINMA